MLSELVVLSAADVYALLPFDECIDAVELALRELAVGRAEQPLRNMMPLTDRNLFAVMPAQVGGAVGAHGLKAVSYFPDNSKAALDAHQGVVTLFEPEHGRPIAILDACSITAIRTAAASALATKVLARPDAATLSIMGTGAQAASHLAAIRGVRPIERVWVHGKDPERTRVFAERHSQPGLPVKPADSARQAVEAADILCTVSDATDPIVAGEWLQAGVHVNAVGACQPTHRELDTEAVRRGRLFTDRMESLERESGDYLIPLGEGAIEPGHVRGELGNVLLGRIAARQDPDHDITIFKSLGIGVEDIAAAQHCYRKAVQHRTGTWVSL